MTEQIGFQSEGKLEIREYLLNCLHASSRVFSLPSNTWTFELLANKKFANLDYTCCENKEFDLVQQNMNKLGIKARLYNENAFEFLINYKGSFDFVWLDLCSYFTADIFLKTLSLFRKENSIVSPTGTFAVTFWLKRTKDFELLKEVYNISKTEQLPNVLTEQIEYFTNYWLIKDHRYLSEGQPMCTLVFKKQ